MLRAFARTAHRFATQSYWGARPEFRLWYEIPNGTVVAHLDFERRTIDVDGREVLIAGVGEVSTDPDWQGHGLGRRLMTDFQAILQTETPVDFGYLNCLEHVVGFYTAVGWHRMDQPSRRLHPDTGEPTTWNGISMILPVRRSLEEWPRTGIVDLRGMSW
jgi:nodulation protein A